MIDEYYKVEGNMLFGDVYNVVDMLTWGPFYYHNEELAKQRISLIRQDIINWVNEQDPSLNIQTENEMMIKSGKLMTFNIKAWKSETELENTTCLIKVDRIFFEDEK